MELCALSRIFNKLLALLNKTNEKTLKSFQQEVRRYFFAPSWNQYFAAYDLVISFYNARLTLVKVFPEKGSNSSILNDFLNAKECLVV